jgi:hypothetical protein
MLAGVRFDRPLQVGALGSHGFAKRANADYAFAAGVLFWRRHLLD